MYIFKACSDFVYNTFSGIASEEQKLRETINENKKSWQSSMHLLPTYAKECCDLAIKFYKAGNLEKANEWIETAKECTDANQARTWEYIRNLEAISKARVEMKMDASEIIAIAIEDIPSLREVAPEITMYTSFAAILMSVGKRDEATELVQKAQKAFEPYEQYDDYQYSWLSRSREQIQEARARLSKH